MGLGLYVMIVVLEMFRAAPVRTIKKVRDRDILRHWHANRDLIDNLRASEAGVSTLPGKLPSVEPAVLDYILDALHDETEDLMLVTEDERWHLLAVLKTVMDALHGACRA